MTPEIQRKLRLDDRFSWSFVGVVLAILFGAFSIYSLFHEARTNLVFEIQSQSDVFDLHRPLQDLSLVFRGQDVQQQKLNVRILTVRIWNKGAVDILQGFYDQQEPWGLKVEPGQIIEVRIGQNNSQYLASHIEPKIIADNTLVLNKVIFERDRFVTFDILVLHRKDTPPRISSFGKIAGLDQISILDVSGQGVKPSFWDQLITGSFLVHGTRFVGYIVILIAIIAALFGLGSVIDAFKRERRRKKVHSALYDIKGDKFAIQVLTKAYIQGGMDRLRTLSGTLKDKNRLKTAIKHGGFPADPHHLPTELAIQEQSADLERVVLENRHVVLIPSFPELRRLQRKGLITISGDENPEVSSELISTVDQLLEHLD